MNPPDGASVPPTNSSVFTQRPTTSGTPQTPSGAARRASGHPEGRQRAVVIGAGLGGLSAAIHLARQGWKVDVIERKRAQRWGA